MNYAKSLALEGLYAHAQNRLFRYDAITSVILGGKAVLCCDTNLFACALTRKFLALQRKQQQGTG